jgi:hypothetical protein
MLVFVIDLDISDTGKLLHGAGERLDDAVGRAIGTAVASQVDVEGTAGKLDATIAYKTVPGCHQAAPLLLRVRALEVFIQGRCNRVSRA